MSSGSGTCQARPMTKSARLITYKLSIMFSVQESLSRGNAMVTYGKYFTKLFRLSQMKTGKSLFAFLLDDIGEFDTLSREKKYDMLLAWSEQQKQQTGKAPTTDEFLNILVDFLDEKDLVDGVLEQLLKSEKAKEKLRKIAEGGKMKRAMQELKEQCGGKRNKAFYKATDLVPDGNWKEFVRVSLELDEDEIRKYHFDNLSRERKYEMLHYWAKQVKKTTGKEPEADEFLQILGEFLTPLRVPVQNIFLNADKIVNQTYEVNAQNFNGFVKNCTHCK